MADTKISGMSEAAALDGTEVVPVVQGGANVKTTTQAIANIIIIDEDDMSSNSATKVPTQQSVKSYVDSQSSRDSDILYFEQFDFITASGINNFSSISSGTGAINAISSFGVDNTEHAIGVWSSSTGTTTTGRAGMAKGGIVIFGTGHIWSWRFRQAIGVLSDGTDTFTVRLGFGDQVNAGEHSEGIIFRYTHSVNSGKWQAVTISGGSETAEDTGVLADTVFHVFKIEVNAAGTEVKFYIDGALTNTITTTIPTSTGINFKIDKTAGTTARLMYQDWHELTLTRSSAR